MINKSFLEYTVGFTSVYRLLWRLCRRHQKKKIIFASHEPYVTWHLFVYVWSFLCLRSIQHSITEAWTNLYTKCPCSGKSALRFYQYRRDWLQIKSIQAVECAMYWHPKLNPSNPFFAHTQTQVYGFENGLVTRVFGYLGCIPYLACSMPCWKIKNSPQISRMTGSSFLSQKHLLIVCTIGLYSSINKNQVH